MVRFESLPRPIRQVAVAAIGARNRWARYGSSYERTLEFIKASREWPRSQQEDWQADRLLRLVNAARAGTQAYRHLPDLKSASRGGGGYELREYLEQLPLLEKAALRRSPKAFINSEVRRSTTSWTSGSTGAPTRFEHDRASLQRRFAFLSNQLQMVGATPFDPSIRLSGRLLCPAGRPNRRPWLWNPAERQLFLSSYHLDEVHQRVIIERVRKLMPHVIDGYPSAVLQVLRLLSDHAELLSHLRGIVTTAETLYEDVRNEIEDRAGVPVMDYYAASEGVPLIQQCPAGAYHVCWQSGIFEVLSNGNCSAAGDGELVVTSFVQDRTPLIRYRTGDLVKGLGPTGAVECSCGIVSPTIDSVEGRIEDMVYALDGRSLGMFTYRTLKHIQGIEQAQVVQEDYSRFTVQAELSGTRSRERIETEIRDSFERALGYPIDLTMTVVDRVPKEPNGKVRLVLSKVDPRRSPGGDSRLS